MPGRYAERILGGSAGVYGPKTAEREQRRTAVFASAAIGYVARQSEGGKLPPPIPGSNPEVDILVGLFSAFPEVYPLVVTKLIADAKKREDDAKKAAAVAAAAAAEAEAAQISESVEDELVAVRGLHVVRELFSLPIQREPMNGHAFAVPEASGGEQ